MNKFTHLTINTLADILSHYDIRSIFLVHGKKSYILSGAKDIFNLFFDKSKCHVTEYSNFTDNPKIEDVKQGVDLFMSESHSLIIGIGGGSVLDVAKMIRFFSAYSGNPVSGKYQKEHDITPLVLFPTTAGTGSEATHFAVCYVNNKKYSVAHPDILPDESHIDYRLTESNSPYLTACAGFDALAQAIESYWSIKSTEKSRKYAKDAINVLYPILKDCVHKPVSMLREQMSYGAHLSGKAINISFTTAAHAYSYGITTYMGLPHGHAVSCGFPYFLEKNFEISEENCNDLRGIAFVQERMGELCTILNVQAATARSGMEAYIRNVFGHTVNIFSPQKDVWFKILDSVNIERLGNNPARLIKQPDITDFCW